MESRVLVTGSSGFIGSYLCNELLEIGYHVDGLDLCPGKFTTIQQDIRDFKYPRKYDKVFHLASLTDARESVKKEEEYKSVIINGTTNLLNKKYVGEFIFTSSVAAVDPISPYGKFKLEAEDLIKQSGIRYVIFRFANVYGRGSKSVVETFDKEKVIKIYGDGEQVRDFIHVNDIIKVLAGEEPYKIKEYNKIFYLGTAKRISINQLASLYGKKPVKYLPAIEGDIKEPIIKSDFDIKNRLLDRL